MALSPHTNPLLLHEIFSNGIPLFEMIPGVFEEQRLRAWKLYLDTAPLRLLERQYISSDHFQDLSQDYERIIAMLNGVERHSSKFHYWS